MNLTISFTIYFTILQGNTQFWREGVQLALQFSMEEKIYSIL